MMFIPPDVNTNKDQRERSRAEAGASSVLWLRELDSLGA
jgi:hypothetical protein